jgi:hypothetical protein
MRNIFLILILCPLTHAQWSVPENVTQAGHATNVTTTSIDCHLSNFAVVGVSDYNNPLGSWPADKGTVTDSQSNTYSKLTSDQDGGNSSAGIYYATNASMSASMTFTYSGGNFPLIMAACFPGGPTSSALDQGPINQGAWMAGTTPIGPIVPTKNNTLIITVMSHDEIGHTDGAFGISGPNSSCYVLIASAQAVSSTSNGGAMAYCVQSTATSNTIFWNGATSGAATLANFFGGSTGNGGNFITGPSLIVGTVQ